MSGILLLIDFVENRRLCSNAYITSPSEQESKVMDRLYSKEITPHNNENEAYTIDQWSFKETKLFETIMENFEENGSSCIFWRGSHFNAMENHAIYQKSGGGFPAYLFV